MPDNRISEQMRQGFRAKSAGPLDQSLAQFVRILPSGRRIQLGTHRL